MDRRASQTLQSPQHLFSPLQRDDQGDVDELIYSPPIETRLAFDDQSHRSSRRMGVVGVPLPETPLWPRIFSTSGNANRLSGISARRSKRASHGAPFSEDCDYEKAKRPSRDSVELMSALYITSDVRPVSPLELKSEPPTIPERVYLRSEPSCKTFSSKTTAIDNALATVHELTPIQDYPKLLASTERLETLKAKHPLPPVPGSLRFARFRYQIFSLYRSLLLLVLIVNTIAIAVMIAQSVRFPGSFRESQAATAVGANLLTGVLMRQEHVINLLFDLALSVPRTAPLSIRRHIAKLAYNNGGIHAGAGISALLWYIFFTVLTIHHFSGPTILFHVVTALSAMLLAVFVGLITLSHPTIRREFHDTWERSHRFGGWAAVAIVWTQFVILCALQTVQVDTPMGLTLITQPTFWFLVVVSCCLIYPWLRTRRLPVQAQKLSDHATRLYFTERRMQTCRGVRLAHNPLLECHGFATIPDPGAEKGYSIVISNAGDFTKGMINDPPKHIWIRGAPVTGVMAVTSMFRPVVVVATGSGIGPCLSWLNFHPGFPMRIVWSARSPEATYQQGLIAEVLRADEHAVIIDTKKTGHPDLVALTYALVREIGAESVTIIANPKVTQEVVFGMEARKIPAFGAIFDS